MKIEEYKGIESSSFPGIYLYMDQLLSILDDSYRDLLIDDEDKVMTKTMVNNYVKDDVIPKPVKKKYNDLHLSLLHMIFRMKNILSISQIKELFELSKPDMTSFEKLDKKVIEEHIEIIKSYGDKEDEAVSIIYKLIMEADYKKRLAEHMLSELNTKRK